MVEIEILLCNDFTGVFPEYFASHIFFGDGCPGFGYSPSDAFCQAVGREVVGQEAVLFVADNVGLSAVAERNLNATSGLGLDQSLAECLIERGGYGDVCGGI